MTRPTIIVIGTPTFYGKSLHQILAEECLDFHVVQASFTPHQIKEPAIYRTDLLPKKNEPWYRRFDKKRIK